MGIKQTVKDWGLIEHLFSNVIFSIERIEIRKGGVSTKGNFHYHVRRFNGIYIESGVLKIYLDTKNKGLMQFELRDDDPERRLMIVRPGVRHRFEAITDVIAYEYYWTSNSDDDIIRLDK